MSHLTQMQLLQLREQLEQDKHDIEHRIASTDHYGLEESIRDQIGELTNIDNHPGDVATELLDRSMDIALEEHDELQLNRINESLKNMAEGTYGHCVVCHQPISFERLQAVPATAYCLEHNPKQVVSDARPVEEEFLMPPFGRTSMDDNDQTGFDGEDAWQAVENFGSSNSPAMAEGNEIESYEEMEIEAYDELEGCVEPYESFVATDITGTEVFFVHNEQYQKYMAAGEGDYLLETTNEDIDDDNQLL